MAQTWVALLRGINVGGHRRVPMAALRAAYEAVGCTSVATYIQSGNVVLDHAETERVALGAILEEAVRQTCAVDSLLVLRTAAEWAAMVTANPFATLDPAFLNVTFLSAAPDASRVAEVESLDLGPDRVQVSGPDVYAWLPDGVLAARLPGPKLERLLGAGTARNWRTVLKITAMVGRAQEAQSSGGGSSS